MEHLTAGMALSFLSALLLGGISSLLLLRRRSASDLLLAALLLLLALVEIFDRFSVEDLGDPGRHKVVVLFLKSLLPLVALPYSLLFARERPSEAAVRLWWAFVIAGLAFPAAVLTLPAGEFYQWETFRESGLVGLGGAGYWFYLGIMVYCIAAMANLEATFAGSSGPARWKIKYEFFGAGTLLGMLVFYLSQGLLYRAVNMNLLPVRSGVFLIGAVFVAYSRLARGGGSRVVVSRYIAYRSFTLLVVGIYLVALGVLGSGIQYLNLRYVQEARTFVFIVSSLLLLLLLFSEQVRRRVKIFVNKHFYAHKYDYRQEWLNFSEALALCRSAKDVHDAIVSAYSSVFGIEGTALYLHDRRRTVLALAAMEREGDVPREFSPSEGLRRYFVEGNRVLNVQDSEYRATPEERAFLDGTGAWLVVPVVSHTFLEGVVVFRQRLVREELTFEDYDMMKTLARQAALSLMSHRLSEELGEAGEMAAIAKVSSFVVHDLKNVAYTFSLMLENAERHLGDRDFQQDLLKSLRNTVAKMNDLIRKLKELPARESAAMARVDLSAVAVDAVREVASRRPGIAILSDLEAAPSRGDGPELKKVALNLVLNALEAVGERGEIRVSTGCRNGTAYLSVADNGAGMSEYFIKNHLFRPFRTTKDGGLGIGLYQSSQIVQAHGGRIDVDSQVGRGSAFRVSLPAAAE